MYHRSLNLIKQPGGSINVVKAIDWTGTKSDQVLLIGITQESIKARGARGQRHLLGQLYGVVDPGMINAEHVFQGLQRDMLVGNDRNAASKKLSVTWASKRDAMLIGDEFNARLENLPIPDGRVFVVHVSPNQMLDEFPDIYGWAEHWTWVAADPVLSGAPFDWAGRYDRKLWSKGE